MRVSTNLHIIRTNRGLSMRQLGKATGIRFQVFPEMERGQLLPTDLQLEAFCGALNVTPEMLYPNDAQREALAE